MWPNPQETADLITFTAEFLNVNLHFLCSVMYVKWISRKILCAKLNQKILSQRMSLKSDSHLPKKTFFIWFNDSPSKMMKNAFYFISKALFVLKIFKFFSWLFGHVEKTALLER